VPALIILESFGTSELLLILVVALIFFGPRKLPQLSRQIGKSLAEFRKASEDFKRTWEREVAMETTREPETTPSILPREQMTSTIGRGQEMQAPVDAGYVAEHSPYQTETQPVIAEPAEAPAPSAATQKRDWF
jgi:Tat protein translocase TatB subunit